MEKRRFTVGVGEGQRDGARPIMGGFRELRERKKKSRFLLETNRDNRNIVFDRC